MTWTLVVLGAVLLLLSMACASRHPVQPVAHDWRVPQAFTRCQVRGDTVRFGTETYVTLVCPDGLVLVNARTGEADTRVTWTEVRT